MRPRLLSLSIHAIAIALLVAISSKPPAMLRFTWAARLVDSHSARLISPAMYRGGGGGGAQSTSPAKLGTLPKFARRQFTPPSATPRAANPVLPMEPTLIALADEHRPDFVLAHLGDPLGTDSPASSGPGKRGGIGGGDGGGVGNHRGPGYGPEDGGGLSAIGSIGGTTAPRVLYRVEPEFSEEARKAKYQGTVILTIEVGEDGTPKNLQIVHSLGLGLDEKAIEAVSRWKFKPASRNGRPVRAPATIEVNFRLL